MNFWPIEEPPLGEDEVLVTSEQFQQLALLVERERNEGGRLDAEMRKVCSELKSYRMNKLVVRNPRSRGCCF